MENNETKIPDDIREFLKTYVEWAYGTSFISRLRRWLGLDPFSKRYGLCYNSIIYGGWDFNLHFQDWLLEVLKGKANRGYPFGKDNYLLREKKGTQHKCPIRRKWILDQLDKD